MYNHHMRILVTIAAIALSVQTAVGQAPGDDHAGQETLAPGQVCPHPGLETSSSDNVETLFTRVIVRL